MTQKTQTGGSMMYLATISFIATLGGFLFGFDTAVISGIIGFVKSQFSLDAVMEGWVVSSALVGCIIGVMGAGSLSDRFGRKKMLLLSAALFFVSAIGAMLPQTAQGLIIARLVGGVGIGMASMLSPMYISEFSPPHLRGRLVALYQFAITVGILAAYFSNAVLLGISERGTAFAPGGLLHYVAIEEVWRSMFGIAVIPSALFFVLVLFVPESPRWLMKQGQREKATGILARVGGWEAAEAESKEIQDALSQESGSLRQLLKPGLRIALLIGILLPFFSQVSGINVVIYYGPKIFKEAGFTLSEALGGAVTIGIVNVLATLIAIWKVDNLGRRPLLLWGITGVLITLTLVGLLFFMNASDSSWLLILFLVYCACFAISYGPVVWIIIAEIFPTSIRGRAMAIGTFVVWATNAVVGQSFPWLLENLGPAGAFWIFAALCIPAIIVVWKLVPETKGKSLEQIEALWLSHEKTVGAEVGRG